MKTIHPGKSPARSFTLMSTVVTAVLTGAMIYSGRVHSQDGTFLSTHKPVDKTRLQQHRGARDVKVANLNEVHGSVKNNTAVDVISGNNSITNGAFSAANGFPMVIQNSGSNVVIQSSTIVNVGLQP